MDCREAFENTDSDGLPCARIEACKPACGCEQHSVSALSPGVVDDTESVARLIYSPHHIDPETGQVKEAAFSDVQDKGLSVQRQAHADPDSIRAIGERKLADDHAQGKTDRQFLGIVAAQVADIRKDRHEDDSRALCVYDTALPGLPAHADVCQTSAGRAAMKRARRRLRKLFSSTPQMP